ncbi:hypothetical protein GWK47_046200 [Chionoecetes opilio]|uniref:Uncharacterized protein n=1 Tax=Chionoecetes opilio TaxID=41210 RepID=A0A8J5CXA5_CHIOP|nr:hypothetical protein GWK47_046200 [Chionoecetes opilio]
MVAQFWDMARTPMIRKDNIVTKIEKLHGEYELLKKGRYRRSEAQISKERILRYFSKTLFDVAHGNALTMMTNQEDKEFLLAQREPGRRGRMGGVDSVLAASGRGNLFVWKGRCFLRPQTRRGCRFLIGWRSSSPRRRPAPTLQLLSQMKNTEHLEERVLRRGRNGPRRNFVSPALAATLDRTKLTDRSATYVLTEAARCLGQNVEELNIKTPAHPSDANA